MRKLSEKYLPKKKTLAKKRTGLNFISKFQGTVNFHAILISKKEMEKIIPRFF